MTNETSLPTLAGVQVHAFALGSYPLEQQPGVQIATPKNRKKNTRKTTRSGEVTVGKLGR